MVKIFCCGSRQKENKDKKRATEKLIEVASEDLQYVVKGLITTKTNKRIEGYDNMNHLYFSVPVDCEQVDEIKVTVKSHDQG